MKKLLLFIILLLNSVVVFSQINNQFIKLEIAPEDIRPCDTSFVYISALFKSKKLSNLEIQLQLPTGVYYAEGLEITTNPGGAYYANIDATDLNKPIVKIQNTGKYGLGQKVIFRFNKVASCEVMQALKNGELFKDIQIVGLRYDNVKQDFSNTDKTTSSYQVLIPALGIQTIPEKDAVVGQYITRDINVVEGGTGHLLWYVHKVILGSDVGNYQLSYNGTNLTPDSISGQEYFYYIHLNQAPFLGMVGDGDVFYENGETVTLTEYFQAQGCADPTVTHSGYWGCSLNDLCEGSKPEMGNLAFKASAPHVTITQVAGDNYMDLCGGQSWTLKFENTATHAGATALDFNINFGLGHNSSPLSEFGTNPFWAFDWRNIRKPSNFRLNGIPVSMSFLMSTVYPGKGSGQSLWLPFDYFTSDPDGPGGIEDIDGDGYYDDLAPGASFELTFDYEWELRDKTCGEGRSDYGVWEHLYIDALFKDQCAQERYTKRRDFEYANIIRDYHNETTYSYPNAVIDGDNFNVAIKPFLYTGGTKKPRCNGEDLFTGPDVTWKVEITVPNGVNLQASAGANYTQSGNTITYTTNKYEYINYIFPLSFDCASYAGGEKFAISFKTTYSCGTCWTQDINCGSIEIQNLCPTSCKGPTIITFDSHRTNPGWTDATKTTQVVLDENIQDLDAYMPKDTMQISTSAIIADSMVQNLFFDVEFETEVGGGDENLFSFINGSIEIKDISSGPFSGAIAAPSVVVVSPNHYKLSFDLSSYTSLVSGSYNYGENNENDTVNLDINFLFSDNFNYKASFKLKNFTGRFYAKDLAGIPTGCGQLYEKAKYIKVLRTTSSYHAVKTDFCEPTAQRLGFWNFSEGDLFPNEFRNPIHWDSTVVTIPDGAQYTGTAWVYNVSGPWKDLNTSNGKIISTLVGNKLTLAPGPGFTNMDQRGVTWSSFYFELIGTCQSIPDEDIDFTVYYQEFAYVTPEPKNHSNHSIFHYFAPEFELSSPHPTVTVVTDEPYLDITICNSSEITVDYNWIKVNQNPGFTITKAFILDASGNETATNFSQINGNTYIEAGQVVNGPSGCKTIRFYGDISSCTATTVSVSHGWDCSAYPPNFEAVDRCYILNYDFTLNPEEAQLQLEVTSLPDSMQYCESFLMQLEINSAQIANLLEPTISLDIAADISFMSIDSIIVEYPRNSGNRQSVSTSMNGGQVILNIFEHDAISDAGIAGSHLEASSDGRIAVIDCYFNLQCGFVDLSTISLGAEGLSPCGSPAISSGVNLTTDDLPVVGKTNDYYVYHDITIPDTIKNCGTTLTIDLESTIIAGTTEDRDTITILIPNGLNYVPGTFACTGVNCPTFVSSTTIAGQDKLSLAIPPGLNNLDEMHYQIDVISKNDYCGVEYFDIESYLYATGGFCGGTDCGSVKNTTGHISDSLIISKPSLVFSTETVATSMVTSTGDTKYGINLHLLNNGIDATSGYEYTVYCADASGNKATQIFSGSFTDNIATGDSLTQIFYFYASTSCDPNNGLVMEIIPSSANCLCEAVSILIPLTPGMDANDDTYTIDEDTNLAANVTDNDTPTIGITVNTAPITNVTNGTLTLNTDGTFTYTPNLDFNGVDSFVYQVCDSGNPQQCDTATVIINITPVTDPPRATDDNYSTIEDTPLTGENVLANDIDPDGGILTVSTTPILNTTNGALTLNTDGTFIYTPNLNYFGQDSFQYEVCNDGSPSMCDTATVYIDVIPVNDPPIAIDDNYTTPEDVTLTGNVTDNDTDVEGGLTVNTAPIFNVTNGTLTLNVDGTFTYVPNADYVGNDSFTYQVCDMGSPALCDTAVVYITVTPVNDPPIAIDDNYTTPEDVTLTGNVTDNDTDIDGDILTLTTIPVLNVSNGTLSLNADGSFTYTPNLNFVGQDSFIYQVCDNGTPSLCDTATAYIDVTPVNDKPIAIDDNYTTPEDVTLTGNVTDNDSDVEGGLTVNTAPIFNVTNGTLTLNADGTFTYVPNADYVGNDSFTYQVCDMGSPALCDTAVVYITVTPVNDPPIAIDDNYYTDTNTPKSDNVVLNDNDPENEGLVVNPTPVVPPLYGNLTAFDDSGAFTYMPATNFNGYDQFTYQVCDNGIPSLCDTAVVYFKIGNVAVLIANPETIDCNTSIVTLDGSGSSQSTSYTYAWTTNTGNVVSGQDQMIAQVDKPGTYTLTVLDTVSMVSASSLVTVTIDTLSPMVNIENPAIITCANPSTFLSGSGSDAGTNFSYEWTTSNGNLVGSTTNILAEANQAGTYQLAVTNTNTGCISTKEITAQEDKALPTAIANTPTQEITCTTLCLDLNASGSSTGDVTYLWTSTNGIIQTGESTLNPTVCAKGTYQLKVTDNQNGCSDSATLEVSENTAAPTVTTASNQAITCDISQVYIEANITAGSGNYTYEWNPLSGIVSGSTTSNPLVNQTGFYNVIVTDNDNGCTTLADVVVAASMDIPTVSLAANDTLTCRDTLVALSATYNSTYSISWNTTDGQIEGDATIANPNVSLIGTYTATVTNTATGCSTTQSVVVASDMETPIANAEDIVKTDCTSKNVQIGSLDNASMSNVQFEWTTIDGNFVSASNLPNPIVDREGTYHLRVINNDNGCSNEDEIEVTELEALSGAEFTTSLPGCDGRTGAILINNIIGSSEPFIYSFNGGQTFGTTPIQVGLFPGDYEVVIHDAMGCEYTETITLPIPHEGDILIEPDVLITMGDSTHLEVFTSTHESAIDTIIWMPNEDLTCLNSCFEQTVKPLETTIYSVTIIDTLGCVSTAKTTVHVADPDIFIPNVFSPNDGDGQNDFFTVMGNTARVEEIVTMQIFDRWGSHIFSKEHFQVNDYGEGWDGTFRGKPAQEGVYIYFLKVRFIDGKEVQFEGDITIKN